MISWFFLLAYSLNTDFPITRYQCGANINGMFYDYNEWYDRKPEIFFDSKSNLTIYAKVCGYFNEDEVPSYFKNYKYYSLAGCDDSLRICFPLASVFSQDYKPLDQNNLTLGSIIEYNGEPNPIQTSIHTWKLTYSISCDPDQNSTKIELKPEVTLYGSVYHISYNFGYSGACPIKKEIPTPTPSPYKPRCQYIARDPYSQFKGINMDLMNLNDGPGGVFFDQLDDKYLLYQPCERIFCPLDAECDAKFSSLWICDQNFTQCKDNGIANAEMNIDSDPVDITRPVTVSFVNGVHKGKIKMSCDRSFPNDHMYLISGSYDNSSTFNLHVATQEVCVNNLPPPTPSENQCNYEDFDKEKNLNVSFDSSKLNKKSGYHEKEITVAGVLDPMKRKLLFQPCDAIFCPPDTDCDQFEDATVWLCYDIVHSYYKQHCDPYGLFKYNITKSRIEVFHLENGVRYKYKGGDDMYTEVDYECNYSLKEGEMILPNNAVASQSAQVLRFSVQTKESCPQGTPIPIPTPFYPPMPTHGPTPSPTPYPFPNPHLATWNKTHYIFIDLSQLDQTIRTSSHIIAYRQATGNADIITSPWITSKCPSGADCYEFESANTWLCWNNQSDIYVCYPIADVKYGLNFESLNSPLDNGIQIILQGHYDIDTRLNVFCDPHETNNYFKYQQNITFDVTLAGTRYNVVSFSSIACPNEFKNTIIPEPIHTPSPNPDAETINSQYYNQKYILNDQMVQINLSKIEMLRRELIIQQKDGSFALAEIHFSPHERIGCPLGYNCDKNDPTNIWKCFQNTNDARRCFSLGDVRYGLHGELANSDHIDYGVKIIYEGGFGNYSAQFTFICDKQMPEDSMIFENVAYESNNTIFKLSVKSSQVCPKLAPPAIFEQSIGSMVMMGIIGIFVLYISVGTPFTFASTGIIAIPNAEFWRNFTDCVKEGFYLVFTCGMKSPRREYEEI